MMAVWDGHSERTREVFDALDEAARMREKYGDHTILGEEADELNRWMCLGEAAAGFVDEWATTLPSLDEEGAAALTAMQDLVGEVAHRLGINSPDYGSAA